jgi:hypothetical protein
MRAVAAIGVTGGSGDIVHIVKYKKVELIVFVGQHPFYRTVSCG